MHWKMMLSTTYNNETTSDMPESKSWCFRFVSSTSFKLRILQVLKRVLTRLPQVYVLSINYTLEQECDWNLLILLQHLSSFRKFIYRNVEIIREILIVFLSRIHKIRYSLICKDVLSSVTKKASSSTCFFITKYYWQRWTRWLFLKK